MNARERYQGTLLGGKIDRFFRYEMGAWASTLEKWKLEGLPKNVMQTKEYYERFIILKNKSLPNDETQITFNEYFEDDPLLKLPIESGYCDSPLFPKFKHEVLSEDDTHYIVRDVDGVTKKIFKDNPDLSMPMFLEFPVKEPSDWKRVKRENMDIGQIKQMLGDIKKIAEDIGESSKREFPVYMTACGGFGHPRNLLGDANLCMAYYDAPEMVKDIMQHWLEINTEILRLVTEHIALDNYLIWEDMSYKNGPLISPDTFKEFITPYYKELIGYAKSRGTHCVMVDTDGDCRKLIPLFLEAGVDAIMPFEVQAGMDIVQIRKDFSDSFCIVGGIDKRALAISKDAIRAEVDRVIPFFIESGRYLPCLDHTVPVNVTYESYCYFLEYLRSYEIR